MDHGAITVVENQRGHHRCTPRALQRRTTRHGRVRLAFVRCRPTHLEPVPTEHHVRLRMPYAQRKPAAFRVAGRAVLAVAIACGTPHDPARDRTLVIALAAEPTLLLPPLIAETPGFVIADQILERLAESWAWAPDSLSIAFRIDPNARWHDGTPVTARDVRFTFAMYSDTAVASPAAPLLANIDSVQVREERVAVFWFHRRHAQQFFDATYHMRILPEHVLG